MNIFEPVPAPRGLRTVSGVPCDHIPSIVGATKSPTTRKDEGGYAYFLMHFGPYGNPQTNWVRADNLKGAKANDKE